MSAAALLLKATEGARGLTSSSSHGKLDAHAKAEADSRTGSASNDRRSNVAHDAAKLLENSVRFPSANACNAR